MKKTSHKQRMLNAYRGIYSDHYPVSPEFWCYYPAKVLGVDMVTFQREIPHWQAMRDTFLKFDADGWCAVYAAERNPNISQTGNFKRISDTRYCSEKVTSYGGHKLSSRMIYDVSNPCWADEHPVKAYDDVAPYFKTRFASDTVFDFGNVNDIHAKAGDDLLLELSLGDPFFDVFVDAMGFENAILYFLEEDEAVLEGYREMYLESRLRLLRAAADRSPFEAFFIGCNASCNSLLGPALWRRWDKPYLTAIVREAHRLGKLVHCHNHGKIMDTVPDLVEIGFDCVCPFEREPGDVIGLDGLKEARRLLDDKVTFNGNVSTIHTLAHGTPDDVRREVREIKEAFAGSPRLIIGSGDQVCGETPEENIYAMINEGRKP